MKIVFTIVVCCVLSLTASAQLNTDSLPSGPVRISAYEARANSTSDHLHPKFPNLANPTGPGYEMDGSVYRSEAIINRHITNINDLIH